MLAAAASRGSAAAREGPAHAGAPTLQRCLASDYLHVILLPTEACNFRCVYCYESFALKRMEPWVVSAAKRLIDRRWDGLRRLEISWFGGEPLLAVDIVEEIQGFVASRRREGGAPAVSSDMTTNASLLTPAVAARLCDVGLDSYQVTFDGPRRFHDRKRVRAGGRGTYDVVWSNLEALVGTDLPLRIMVRLHLDQDNVAAVDEFLGDYRRAFGSDGRFELFIRGLSRLGGPNDSSLNILQGDDGRRLLDAVRRRARAEGIRLARIKEEACYAAHANSFVVRADGRINKCTVALEHRNNQVGRIREDGSLALDGGRLRPWLRGLDSGERSELQCPMRGLADRSAVEKGIATIPLRVAG